MQPGFDIFDLRFIIQPILIPCQISSHNLAHPFKITRPDMMMRRQCQQPGGYCLCTGKIAGQRGEN